MKSTDLGFDKNEKIVVPFKDEGSLRQYDFFNSEVKKLKDITGTAGCAYYPSRMLMSDFLVYKAGDDMNSSQLMKINRVDDGFFALLGIPIIAGRNLSLTDTFNQVIANEKALQILNIEMDKAIGASLYAEFEGNREEFEIVGVTRDYNFNSLREDINPMLSFYNGRPSYMIIQTNTNDYQELLVDLGSVWRKTVSQAPFEYSFLDSDIQNQYAEETTLKKISNSFTLLAILISCLGLFGLAMFTAQQRTKEIGVRKVLGASATGIAALLTKDFLKLVFISILIASPLAWWAMNKWLADFTYRITISWWVFVLAGMVALLIAFVTVSFQSIKAAVANPVKSLRTE